MGKRILFLLSVVSLALVITTSSSSVAATVHEDDDGPIIGLDFGAFDSCVGVSRDGQVEIIPNQFGNTVIPSWVYFGDFLQVGDLAVDLAHHNAHAGTALFAVKRFLGLHPSEATLEEDKSMGYVIDDDPLTNKTIIHIENQALHPEFIAGMILATLKQTAEWYLGSKITSAVISVPGVFGHTQRQAIIDAATIGGFKSIRLINDPTSIALAYGISKIERKKVLVVDFGGSSVDVGIVTSVNGNVHVLGGGGSFNVGGRNFNTKLMEFIYRQVMKERKVNPFHDFPSIMKSWNACEAAKIELSKVERTTIEIQLKDRFKVEYKISIKISREQFELLIEEHLLVVKNLILRAIENASINKKDVDMVLLVGGSSKIPKFKEIMLGLHKWKKVEFLEKEKSVAYGAALYGGMLSGNKGIQLYDTTRWSVGLEVQYRVFGKVFDKNDVIPANRSITLHTTEEKNVTVFEIFSNGHKDCMHRLGSVTLPKTSKGNVDVTVGVNANGVVEIRDGWNSDAVEHVLHRDSLTELQNYVRDRELNVKVDIREGDLSVKGSPTQESVERVIKSARKRRRFPVAHHSHDDL